MEKNLFWAINLVQALAALVVTLVAYYYTYATVLVGIGIVVLFGVLFLTNNQKGMNAIKWPVRHLAQGYLLGFRLLQKVGNAFMAMPAKNQAMAFGLAILAVLVATTTWWLWPSNGGTLQPSVAHAEHVPHPDLIPVPLASERTAMSVEQVAWRANRIIQTRTFWIMRESGVAAGADRIISVSYQQHLKDAAERYGVSAKDIEAIHFLESFGRPDAKSPTGPKGPGQFTAVTASNIGPVEDGKCLLRFEGYNCGSKLPKKLPKIAEDNRSDIRLSAFATAKLLADETKFFGDPDFAIMAYHSSRKRVADWVKIYLSPKPTTTGGKADIQKYGLSYAQLYFGSTPYHNPGTYRMFRELMDVDWGPNYLWKVRRSQGLLDLRRNSPSEFATLAENNRHKGKRANYRMWTFYTDEDEAFVSLADLKKSLEAGELVVLPDRPDKFGFKLRLEGGGAIAEMDRPNQKHYLATKPETAGGLIHIAQLFSNLRKKHGAKEVLLDITSVSRTVEYQNRLVKQNSTATKDLSFHVLGLAIDIAKKNLNESAQRDLRFVLDELDSIGLISWVPEKAAYHIVIAPEPAAREFFTRIYAENKDFYRPSPLAVR